jgi:hypothetical protein
MLQIKGTRNGISIAVSDDLGSADGAALRDAAQAALASAGNVEIVLEGNVSRSSEGIRLLADLARLGSGVRFRVGSSEGLEPNRQRSRGPKGPGYRDGP